MIRFPNCKINLGLHITSKREDGYHNLETVFYPIALKDAIEIITSDDLAFNASGLTIDGDTANNLCLKAYHLLKKDFPQIEPVKVHLHKAIPMGAGLGGGSSNGAFMLKMLNEKFDLYLPDERLMNYALQLGSDCPFFIINKPCYATGRGEILQPVEVDLSLYDIVLVNPRIHVSTGEAFSTLIPNQAPNSIQAVVQQPVSTWRNNLRNDFETPMFKTYPEIKTIKEQLYKNGAIYASMTGTGSTVYGLFIKNSKPQFSFPDDYTIINVG